MSFGFGQLPPRGLTAEDLARLFDPRALGAPQGFSGSAGGTLPGDMVEVPTPPARPLSFGPAPQSARRSPPRQVLAEGMVPLPPQRPAEFGNASQADLPAEGAMPVMGQVPQAEQDGPSFGDRLLSGLRANGDYLGALGAGLLSSPTWAGGLSAGMQMAQQGEGRRAAGDLARAEMALKVQKLRKEQQGENATGTYLRSKGLSDELASAAMANPTVLSSVLGQLNKDPSRVTIGGNIYELRPNERPSAANLLGPAEAERDQAKLTEVTLPDGRTQKVWLKPGETEGTPVGAPEASGSANVSAQVQQRRDAIISQGGDPEDQRNKDYILTGRFPKEDQSPLTVTDKKAILEADEMVQASKSTIRQLNRAIELSKKAYTGPTAAMRGYATSLFGSEAGTATQELDNQVTAQALENLKATFGGAPTEGERKILLDIQGASSQAPQVREEIYRRAIAAAERQLKFNEERANQLRGGTYYKRQGDAASAARAAPARPSGDVARPQSKSDYDALPSGAQYIAPDGSQRTKP